MSNEAVEFRFSSEQREFLAVSVRGRAYHHSRDYWDGNWLLVDVSIAVGKFSGTIPGLLRAEELQTFIENLHGFSHAQTGVVTLITQESWLTIHVEADTLGHIRLWGSISDEISMGNTLNFVLQTTPVFLSATIEQLHHVITTFPIVTSP